MKEAKYILSKFLDCSTIPNEHMLIILISLLFGIFLDKFEKKNQLDRKVGLCLKKNNYFKFYRHWKEISPCPSIHYPGFVLHSCWPVLFFEEFLFSVREVKNWGVNSLSKVLNHELTSVKIRRSWTWLLFSLFFFFLAKTSQLHNR